MRRTSAVVALLVVMVAAIAGITTYLALGQYDRAHAVADPRATQVAGHASAPRVSDLMHRAGCSGGVIGAQLYSRETGRCTYRGVTVTVAAFETNALRDQWVTAARQFGGTFVRGQLWAAMVGGPDQARALASALGGALA